MGLVFEERNPSSHAPFTHTLGLNTTKGVTQRSACVREKAAILKLREKGCRIQHIAEFLGRSTSFVHRHLKKAQKYGYNRDVWQRTLDLRKIPYRTRMHGCFVAWDKLHSLWSQWEAWILGEGERPP